MDISRQILSDIIIYMKYARYDKKKKRRETWDEIVDRYEGMMIKKYPKLKDKINDACQYIRDKKILPSMRCLQFGGKAIEKNNSRSYNCVAMAMSHIDAFKEFAFLLMSGCGVGFSVQKQDVDRLPEIYKPKKTYKFLVGDSIEGWAEAIGALINSYMGGRKTKPKFDFSDIRQKGEKLKTSGGTAPGPEPLKICLAFIENILNLKKDGEKLTPLEVHDINCHIADCVIVAGTRRSSSISVFSFDDTQMIECKFGDWYVNNPQRARANNSAMILRHKIDQKEFEKYFELIKQSRSGEPGFLFSNNSMVLTNPCQPGSAFILTPKGIKQLKDIYVGDIIYTQDGWYNVINKTSSGKQNVYKYETSCGSFIGTKEHKIISNGKKIEVQNCKNIDKLTGLFAKEFSCLNFDAQSIMDGLVIGDGSVHKASNNLIHLYIGKNDSDYFNSEIKSFILKHRPGIKNTAYEIKTTITINELPKTFERKVPDRFFYGEIVKVLSFLRGLYSANGSVCGNRVTLKATSKTLIEQVQIMLSSIGISSYVTTNKKAKVKFGDREYLCKQSYDLNISSDRDKFLSAIGFIQTYKNNKIKITKTNIKKNSYNIINTQFLGKKEVFDITVNSPKHTYWSGGLNVSNCGEISLRTDPVNGTGTMCNLTEINTSTIESQNDLNERARIASFLGTLQAGFTDFHFLRQEWKDLVEKDALIGVSLTGIASGKLDGLNLKEAAEIVKGENELTANEIGVNCAARCTTVKPSGTASSLLGCSSGIHSWHSEYYIRRIRVGKDEPIYFYLKNNHPELIEDDYFKPTSQAVISVPIKAPEGSITRRETALQFLNRVAKIYKNWIIPGHRKGYNTNNISATVTIKEHEWDKVGNWLWENKDSYTAISLLPYDDHTYVQAPFEEIDEDTYNKMIQILKKVDLSKISEEEDNTNLQGEVACGGGSCEII